MGVLNDLIHVVSFSYVKRSEVLSVSENSVSRISTIAFVNGKGWVRVNFTPGQMKFTEKQNKEESAGTKYIQGFTGQLAGNNFVYPDDLLAMAEEPVICRIEYSNGLVLIVGNIHVPVRMSYTMATNEHECVVVFERTSKGMCYKLAEDSEVSGSGQ